MKKLGFFLVLIIGVFSCSENIQDQREGGALQVSIDGVLFQASNARAIRNEDGTYLIQGLSQNQDLSILLPDARETTYELGGSSATNATFKNFKEITYFTNPGGGGMVTISNIDTERGELTGSFYFDAIVTAVDTIAGRNGVFYEVPIFNEIIVPIVEEPEGIPVTACDSGTFVASIDGDNLQQGVNLCVMAVLYKGKIVITASDPDEEIQIRIPFEVLEGDSFELPSPGIEMTYKDTTTGSIESVTLGELFVFEFNPSSRIIKCSFGFRTENHIVSQGGFNVTYE
ncbi:DUF6252 family protein [Patiriisocius sp. Uisw_017]|jgi:hypothetical protein|uniref:DUF6252 family protein n=1 Tax=Patiriisocius sp. Uisw_017 TaxID=3230968 RepID=UPI0039EB0865